MRRKLRKNKAEDSTKHGTIGSDRGIGERERAAEIEQKVSNLRNRRARDRVTVAMAPGTIHSPLSLVIYPSRSSAAEDKLTSHRRREAGMSCGLLDIRQAVS